jgi:hypothetical protein
VVVDVLQKSLVVGPLMFALGFAPALAKTTVIAELGTAPLLGTSRSTADMQARVSRNEGVLSAAAAKLGLTPSQYAQFHAELMSSRTAYVTVPRHLDSMTWQGGGHVYALNDVQIPANTHGWEVDLPASNGRILALYMPALCGNLSLLIKSAPVVAQHHVPVPTRVAALAAAPPPAAAPVAPVVEAPVAEAPVAAAPPAAVPNDEVAPVAAPVVAQAFPPVAAAAVAHASFLPFLIPILAGVAALGGGSSGGPVVVPPVGCP